MSHKREWKRILEALLFASSEPLSLSRMRSALEIDEPLPSVAEIEALLQELSLDYAREGRSFQISHSGHSYQLQSRAEFDPYIRRLQGSKRGERISPASTEVLAIIAYRGPITRPQLEAIRGVDCSATLHTLIERELVRSAGRASTPGKPTLYAITEKFLHHYGLRDRAALEELLSQ